MKIDIYPFKLYAQRPLLLGFVLTGLFLNLAAWVWILYEIPKSDDQLVLHYNIIFGVDRVGTFSELLATPTFGFGILIINYVLGWFAFKFDRFMSAFLIFSALLVNFFVFINGLLLVFLNV